MLRIVLAQARVSAKASALTPSAAARPNVRSTMVIGILLQTPVSIFVLPHARCLSGHSGSRGEIGLAVIIANSKATILLACFATFD
ncbi:hypothetical protein [Novosphingobium beihaiensis]|uniref:Uncharacterized protein n=1 Tax=Novosphingobium beihaiensis TaxID=2930389 RepID=A0ABT0BPL5_9SPHN|nr:hypothetical protein [Novosphingobium beihaiensis]MCJ2187001.1 hypothetical protein [Novosphingobium beihaiensis]